MSRCEEYDALHQQASHWFHEYERLRQAVERHHDVMANVLMSIHEVEPRHIGVATSVGFYKLRDWVVRGLDASESNFRVAARVQDDELDAEELHPSAPWNIAGMD